MPEQSWTGRRAVITGAGSGIGRAFALRFARMGADLVLCDIAEDRLEPVAVEARSLGVTVHTFAVDVRDAAAMRELAATVSDLGPVHLLINNAGVATAGRVLDTPPEDWKWVVDVNLHGVVNGCQAFLPGMIAHGDKAHVINLASASAYIGSPGIGAYSVTKHGVLGRSEVLDAELQATAVQIHVLCPGFVPTRILDDARIASATPERDRKRAGRLFKNGRSPDQVVQAALSAMRSGRLVVSVFPEAHALRVLRALPEVLARPIRRAMARRAQRIAGVMS